MQNKCSVWFPVLLPVITVLTLVSCKKEKKHPSIPTTPTIEMEYFNLNNTEIKGNANALSIDVTHDGRSDILFSTLLVGDPIYQVDKFQFLISTDIGINLPVNVSEEVPVMNNSEPIAPEDFNGFHWFELSTILLVQKIISFNEPPVWDGHWKNAVHKYLPYQVVENNKLYNGWIELTVDTAGEKVIVHKAAISKEPGKIVKAGE
jgi:hypothetical protein